MSGLFDDQPLWWNCLHIGVLHWSAVIDLSQESASVLQGRYREVLNGKTLDTPTAVASNKHNVWRRV